jgi:N-acetyl-alpha-D-glucosaminyl L-malate synthase BshA
MKIAIVCYPVRGGSGVVASELGIGLSKRGCEVHFFSYELPFRLTTFEANFIFHEIDILHYPLFKYPPYTETLAARLADESLRHRFDIIHAHYAIPHATAAYLAARVLKNEAPKIITTLHGTDITLIGQDRSFFSITKFSIEQSDGVTTVSRYLREETLKAFSLKKDIRVIPNFVDTDRFQPGGAGCARRRFANSDEKIIMHMSNFRQVKNAPDVVRAFKIIQQEIPSRLILVGDGPDAGNVLNLVRDLGLSEKVIFLGNQDRVQYILPLADLFLLPSASEAFGLAALEALSCGVPVVASNIGGLPELIEEGVTGFLLPAGDFEGMADKSIKILKDNDLAQKMSAAARQVALDKYQTGEMIARYQNYYEEIING